jgi:hypothetical protein
VVACSELWTTNPGDSNQVEEKVISFSKVEPAFMKYYGDLLKLDEDP